MYIRFPSRGTASMVRVAGVMLGLVLCACRSDSGPVPNGPAVYEARAGDSTALLDVSGDGSTGSGVLKSDRTGIDCSIGGSTRVATRGGRCMQSYATGTAVTIIARPAAGSVLAEWMGCTAASDDPNSCQVDMDQPRKVVAVFATPAAGWVLKVAGGASGTGSIVSSPAGINCRITKGAAGSTGCSATFADGLDVTLTATAAAANFLKAWAGAGCDTAGTGAGLKTGTCTVKMTQKDNLLVSFDNNATITSLGRWEAPIRWPVIGIHVHLLPDGRVMTWGRTNAPVIWNPADGSFTSTVRPVDLFCSGHSFLPDGRLLVTGGHGGVNDKGIPDAQIFDYRTNTWSPAPNMRNGRWYPTNTTLPNGEVLTVAGGDTLKQPNIIPEVYQTDGTWRALTGAALRLPYYPMMFVAPDGRIFAAGPMRQTAYLDATGAGKWTKGPLSHLTLNRDYGSAVMYDAGKILILGGGGPTNTAEVIDLNAGASAAWRLVAPMSIARRQTTATLLPDGRTLVTGGTNAGGFNTAPTTSAVLAAEMWDPVTEQWTTLARMTHYRVYHGSALLLPDGRVLSVGSGQPPATGLTNDYTAEIFNPPYLYQANGTLASRPSISSAPSAVAYGQSFTVSTPSASSVSKVTWIRLGSVTHSFDQNQRMNYLSFSVVDPSTITVTAPGSANLSPPGHYMLFLVDAAGVPSVGSIMSIN